MCANQPGLRRSSKGNMSSPIFSLRPGVSVGRLCWSSAQFDKDKQFAELTRMHDGISPRKT